ncbi:hypothetical protein F4779DRAFT_203551 [Xylariaceae sp. FL0662B]|nr:hypothetical protein F4779DRAFT_203551 [Xylariaceae sp. FL0662B]
MDYRAQRFGDSVNEPLHMISSAQVPSTLVHDDAGYMRLGPSAGDHNVSYIPGSTTLSLNRTPESLMAYQNHSLPASRIPSNSSYAINGHLPTETDMGSSSGTSFTTPAADPFEISFYQPVTPEVRPNDSAEAYHYTYSQGYGASVTSPPMPSPPAGAQHKKHRQIPRSRKASYQQSFSPESSSSTSNIGKSRLRSASRTSKNTHHNPPATVEERKSRETHNQVEKQYRNRLNSHFESLLDVLPETMQTGEGDENGESLDLTDRRVSKAEVLDMARRHIQALERECAALEGERDELRSNMVKLRWFLGRNEGSDGFDNAAAMH